MDVLLNWLAQGAIVAMAAAAGLRIFPPSRPQARYAFAWTAYLLLLALPAVPFAVAAVAAAVPPIDPAPVFAGGVSMPAVWWTSPAAASSLWIIWSGVHAVQFAIAAVAVRHARRESQECPREVLAALPHWSQLHTTGRRTRVVLSPRVRFAAVVGCGSPMIALAPGLTAQLSAADLDRVLVHEWAHVQRRDDLAQLVQQFVRAIVGWHPAAWWLERQLEFEREAACDEVAVAVTGSAKGYAACLATLAGLPPPVVRSVPGLAAVTASTLGRRLSRILSPRCATGARLWRAVPVCGGAVGLAALALAVSNVRVVASTDTFAAPLRATTAPDEPGVISGPAPLAHEAGPPTLRSNSVSLRRQNSSEAVQRVVLERGRSRNLETQPAPGRSPTPAAGQLLRSMAWSVGTEVLTPLAASTPGVRVTADSAFPPADTRQTADQGRAPWTAAADAGIAIGRTSKSAGVTTAGSFSHLGKRIARSY